MRVKVLKKSKGYLKIEVDGEGHTFSHLLQEALLSDKTVDRAGYDIEHPLFSRPTVTVRMKGDASPEKAMDGAATNIQQESDEFTQNCNGSIKGVFTQKFPIRDAFRLQYRPT